MPCDHFRQGSVGGGVDRHAQPLSQYRHGFAAPCQASPCAAPSMPSANPLTTPIPSPASRRATANAASAASGDGVRVPTMATSGVGISPCTRNAACSCSGVISFMHISVRPLAGHSFCRASYFISDPFGIPLTCNSQSKSLTIYRRTFKEVLVYHGKYTIISM